MVIIAIKNIPPKMNLKGLVKSLAPIIRGHFEALNFTHSKNGKTAYIRLAEKLSTKDVINAINANKLKCNQMIAFVPDTVPNLPLAHTPKTIPTKIRRKLHIPLNVTAKELLSKSLENIVKEMQNKFVGLYRLSESTKHQLLETIGRVVYQRLKQIVDDPMHTTESGFQLTKNYRKRYPHHTDFQFIIQTLHSVQDSLGRKRTNPQEKQMTTCPLGFGGTSEALPFDTLNTLCQNHIVRISQKLVGHVNGLEVKEETSTPEEAATMKVRKHLKDLAQYIPSMVQQVITKQLIPVEDRFCVVKIYGEPYLPGKDAMMPFIRQFRPTNTIRSEHMYNLISVKVPREMHLKLLQADGTVLSENAKLVIRPTKLSIYKVSKYLTDAAHLIEPLPAEDQGTTGDQAEEADMEWSDSW
ncbi:uncharacterized protein LOC123878162 isoform X2 [Maniola jurtina]|uniref:uncharacterized protein LOC123878162 isoform X2 n=1 Tax=Maniola jurtina TaxID=191418 RepID=UPI001E689E0C|nr:uncharacterized protein LOC123878162 isoform X2 [Maniola jurtina]